MRTLIFFILSLVSSMLISQRWEKTNAQTKEGYNLLLADYENEQEKLLPLLERLDFYKTIAIAARFHQDSTMLPEFAYKVASVANALDSMQVALEYISIARNAVSMDNDYAVDIISYQGVLHKQIGDYEQALGYYEEALLLAQEKFPDNEIMTLGNLATLYRTQQEYQKSLEYLHELNGRSYAMESPRREYHRVYNYAEYCINHDQLNQLDSARYYAELCAKTLEKLDKREFMKAAGFGYITAAEFYIGKAQQPQLAKPLLDSAFLYAQGSYLTKVKISLGKYYLAVQELANAGILVGELQEESITNQTTQLRALELAEKYYLAVQDFPAALASVRTIQTLKEDRFNKQKSRLTAFYAAKFENKEQLDEIRVLQNQQLVTNLRLRSQRLTFLLVSILVIGVAVFLWLQNRRRKTFSQVLQAQVVAKTQDLQMVNEILNNQVDKLDAFTYTVSHDLKAPLTSAINYVDLLKQQMNDLVNETTKKSVVNLGAILSNMKEMVNGVSSFMEVDKLKLKPERIMPKVVTEEVINQLQYYSPNHLKKYNLSVESEVHEWDVDPLLFRQMMTNLLSNAIKATRNEEHPQIAVTFQGTDETITVRVTDNGLGLPVKDQSRLFELFKSGHTRNQFPGTGVGLSIVKRIIERHNGSVRATSDGEGKGATFTLTFPHQAVAEST